MLTDGVFYDLCAPIRHHLDRKDLLDLCINKPGEIWLDTVGGWEHHKAPTVTNTWCNNFVTAASNVSSQRTDRSSPLLSTTLMSGERIYAVLPPAALAISMTLRRPSDVDPSLDDYHNQGRLGLPVQQTTEASNIETVQSLYQSNQIKEMLKYIVHHKLNLIISGTTGSGKTSITKALIREMPKGERLISIEDSPELNFIQPNVVRLIYSRDKSGVSSVLPSDLLRSCLRMKPDRILLTELSGAEAFDYLKKVNSGHPGSITTIHANDARSAIDQLYLMIKESPAGAGIPGPDVYKLINSLVDVVLHWENWNISHAYFPGCEQR